MQSVGQAVIYNATLITYIYISTITHNLTQSVRFCACLHYTHFLGKDPCNEKIKAHFHRLEQTKKQFPFISSGK